MRVETLRGQHPRVVARRSQRQPEIGFQKPMKEQGNHCYREHGYHERRRKSRYPRTLETVKDCGAIKQGEIRGSHDTDIDRVESNHRQYAGQEIQYAKFDANVKAPAIAPAKKAAAIEE